MVEFLTAWNGTPTGKRVELGAVEEARLIAAGIARAYTAGQEKGPGTDLTDAEEAWVRSSLNVGERGSVSNTLLVGDSNTQFLYEQAPTPTAIVNNGDGTATITFAGSHNFSVGAYVFVNNAPAVAFNTFGSPITAQVNSGTFSITYTLSSRNSPLTGANAAATTVFYVQRLATLGYATWLQALQAKPMNYVVAAAGGATAAQCLTMYNDALATANAARCGDVIVMAGTNDIFRDGGSFDTVKASLKALVDRIVATFGGRVWWLLVPPLTNTASAWSAGKQVIASRINRWIWRYAHEIGATPVDTWRASNNGTTCVNGAATNPDWSTNFAVADLTHTAANGAYAIARAINTLMQQTAALQALQFQGGHSSVHAQGNVLPNTALTGTAGTKTAGGGTITGTVPDSWTLEITSGTGTLTTTSPARTVAADGDAAGNNLQVIPSVAAITWRLINTSSIHSSVTAGEVRELVFPLTITGGADITGIEVVIFGANATGGNTNIGITGTSSALVTGDYSLSLRTGRWTVPTGLTSLTCFLRITQTGTPAGTFVIGKPALELIE